MNHIGRKPPGFTITLFLFLILPWLVSCSVSYRPSLTPALEHAFANALERFRLQHEFPGITANYEELNDRFLGPLRLEATTASNQRSLSNLAAGYVAADNAFGFPLKTTDQNGVLVWHPGLEWTGGGLISTSRDLAHWGDALFRSRALPDEDLHAMLESVPIGADTPGIHYGLGIAINQSGPISPVYGHGGWIPGYSSSLRHYPGSGITIAFQVNSDRLSHNNLSEIELCLVRIVISDGQNTACVP